MSIRHLCTVYLIINALLRWLCDALFFYMYFCHILFHNAFVEGHLQLSNFDRSIKSAFIQNKDQQKNKNEKSPNRMKNVIHSVSSSRFG